MKFEQIKPDPKYHLCHLNIGPAQAPLFEPQMAGFVSRLAEINQLAAESPGFVWQLFVDIYNPEDIAMYGEPGLLFNMSVWDSIQSLWNFTYSGEHAIVMQSRRQWFQEMSTPNYVLWWIPAGEIPTLMEAKARINYLTSHGPSPFAFTFKDPYPADAELYSPERLLTV